MAAVTGIFCVTPTAGINLYFTTISINTGSSRQAQNLMESVEGSDGRRWIFGKSIKVQTSVATVSIGVNGSIVSCTTTTANWMMNYAAGLAVANTYCWIRRRTT